MANMQINYPNEVQNFAIGAQTGMALGSMWNKNKQDNVPNIPMNDPGQMPQIDINQLTQQEQADIAQYQELEKKSKGLDETSMYEVKQAGVNSSQSQIVKQAMLMGIPAKDLDSYMKDIQNKGINSPSAIALKGKLGGEKSAGWQAVIAKATEINNTQKKLTEDWALKAKNALLDLNDIELNPNKYSYKGQVNESVAQFMQNVPNYIPALANTSEENKKWVMEYLKNRENLKAKAGGGGKPFNYMGYDKKTGDPVTDSAYSQSEFRQKHPNVGDIVDVQGYTNIEKQIITSTGIKAKEQAKNKKVAPIALQQKYYKEELKKNNDDITKAALAAKARLDKEGYTELE